MTPAEFLVSNKTGHYLCPWSTTKGTFVERIHISDIRSPKTRPWHWSRGQGPPAVKWLVPVCVCTVVVSGFFKWCMDVCMSRNSGIPENEFSAMFSDVWFNKVLGTLVIKKYKCIIEELPFVYKNTCIDVHVWSHVISYYVNWCGMKCWLNYFPMNLFCCKTLYCGRSCCIVLDLTGQFVVYKQWRSYCLWPTPERATA